VNSSANNNLDDTCSLLQSRRRGSGRGAAALAVRQAEAEAIIAGAMKVDATGQRESSGSDPSPSVLPVLSSGSAGAS
jgi:hypothetical protein